MRENWRRLRENGRKLSKLGDRHYWTQICNIIQVAMSNKPNIKCGSENCRVHSQYICFCYQKEKTKSRELGEYSFNCSRSKEIETHIKTWITNLLSKMENTTSSLTSKLPEYANFKHCQKTLSLPTFLKFLREKITHGLLHIG